MRQLTCTIIARNEPILDKVFLAEEKKFTHNRSEYDVKRKGKDVHITIEADDPIALRATVTSVTRILGIVKKVKE